MDYGLGGLRDTIGLLEKEGINYTGAGEYSDAARSPALIFINRCVAILAYSNVFPKEFYATKTLAGTAHGIIENIRTDIKNLKELSDIIVVSFQEISMPFRIKIGRGNGRGVVSNDGGISSLSRK